MGFWLVAPIGICGVAAGVEPELPGVVVPLEVDPLVDGVVPLADGVDPELPGVVVPLEVDPLVDGVVPLADGAKPEVLGRLVLVGTVGAITAVALTGVVATVTSETTARLTAPGAEADLPGVVAVTGVPEPPLEPPPELPEEFAVHCATHVIAAAVIVTVAPAEIVEPLLQLQPAKV